MRTHKNFCLCKRIKIVINFLNNLYFKYINFRFRYPCFINLRVLIKSNSSTNIFSTNISKSINYIIIIKKNFLIILKKLILKVFYSIYDFKNQQMN